MALVAFVRVITNLTRTIRMKTKKCGGQCGKVLSVSAFGVCRRSPSRLQRQCRECHNAAKRKSYKVHREQRIADTRKWREDNPDGYWHWKLWHKYGMRPVDYWRLFAQQEGVCGVCGEPETVMQKGKIIKLAVDHNHETGEIRGLLCNRCNLMTGVSSDDPELLETGATWIRTAKTGMFVPGESCS